MEIDKIKTMKGTVNAGEIIELYEVYNFMLP